ncbi:MAG: hypothetical protein P1V18_00770 [Candidatus Gracilibacteria bacterium]|nr:hypothetical protein [Candidatus Gracilibacteria bacterium]
MTTPLKTFKQQIKLLRTTDKRGSLNPNNSHGFSKMCSLLDSKEVRITDLKEKIRADVMSMILRRIALLNPDVLSDAQKNVLQNAQGFTDYEGEDIVFENFPNLERKFLLFLSTYLNQKLFLNSELLSIRSPENGVRFESTGLGLTKQGKKTFRLSWTNLDGERKNVNITADTKDGSVTFSESGSELTAEERLFLIRLIGRTNKPHPDAFTDIDTKAVKIAKQKILYTFKGKPQSVDMTGLNLSDEIQGQVDTFLKKEIISPELSLAYMGDSDVVNFKDSENQALVTIHNGFECILSKNDEGCHLGFRPVNTDTKPRYVRLSENDQAEAEDLLRIKNVRFVSKNRTDMDLDRFSEEGEYFPKVG